MDKCVEVCNLKTTNGCLTKGLLLDGAYEWSPTLFIRLIQDFGLDHEVSSLISIHSGHFYSRLFKFTSTQRHFRHSIDTVSEFHTEAPQATASEGLAQGPYVATGAGFEPTTLLTIGIESTNEPPCLIVSYNNV